MFDEKEEIIVSNNQEGIQPKQGEIKLTIKLKTN